MRADFKGPAQDRYKKLFLKVEVVTIPELNRKIMRPTR
jgi:hypothetical protein